MQLNGMQIETLDEVSRIRKLVMEKLERQPEIKLYLDNFASEEIADGCGESETDYRKRELIRIYNELASNRGMGVEEYAIFESLPYEEAQQLFSEYQKIQQEIIDVYT